MAGLKKSKITMAACVRKIPTLQEKILQIYEVWLCNVWSRSKFQIRIRLIGFDQQIYSIMEEVFKEEIPYLYGGIFQLMKIRKYLKKHPGKVLEIAQLYHQRFHS